MQNVEGLGMFFGKIFILGEESSVSWNFSKRGWQRTLPNASEISQGMRLQNDYWKWQLCFIS